MTPDELPRRKRLYELVACVIVWSGLWLVFAYWLARLWWWHAWIPGALLLGPMIVAPVFMVRWLRRRVFTVDGEGLLVVAGWRRLRLRWSEIGRVLPLLQGRIRVEARAGSFELETATYADARDLHYFFVSRMRAAAEAEGKAPPRVGPDGIVAWWVDADAIDATALGSRWDVLQPALGACVLTLMTVAGIGRAAVAGHWPALVLLAIWPAVGCWAIWRLLRARIVPEGLQLRTLRGRVLLGWSEITGACEMPDATLHVEACGKRYGVPLVVYREPGSVVRLVAERVTRAGYRGGER